MRDQKNDFIRYRYNIVAEDGRTVIRAVPVRTSFAAAEREPATAERPVAERERADNAGAAPVLRRLRDRFLER